MRPIGHHAAARSGVCPPPIRQTRWGLLSRPKARANRMDRCIRTPKSVRIVRLNGPGIESRLNIAIAALSAVRELTPRGRPCLLPGHG